MSKHQFIASQARAALEPRSVYLYTPLIPSHSTALPDRLPAVYSELHPRTLSRRSLDYSSARDLTLEGNTATVACSTDQDQVRSECENWGLGQTVEAPGSGRRGDQTWRTQREECRNKEVGYKKRERRWTLWCNRSDG